MGQHDKAMIGAKTLDDLDAWVSGGGEVHEMMRFVEANPNFSAASLMKSWLRREDGRREEARFHLEKRTVDAVEVSAKAARDSARAATIAVGISLVALAVTVAAYIKPPEPLAPAPQPAPTLAAPNVGAALKAMPAASGK